MHLSDLPEVMIPPEFEQALALQRAAYLADPSPSHAQRLADLSPALAIDASALPNSKDGNTVNFENEMMQLNQNTMAHTLETQLVSNALMRLKLAISGKP